MNTGKYKAASAIIRLYSGYNSAIIEKHQVSMVVFQLHSNLIIKKVA